ncbi:PREDICTED: uncharacterized protein LOC105562139 isoform X2 [Vollenhovia emeryi]|uniref:uncharacterized protein LOC105562139 isoform X2 n=1 Tax=Vollenhovia emeryi TaxID=411798 RepID=UPI0005F39805|nr:PREDICTED: uncharacterized protein LOC105562139 isoform X2 [Vollenhovia emeryi]
MTFNWYAGDLGCNSQNFHLRLSAGSSIENSSPQRSVGNRKTEDDVIVISDSSCDSSHDSPPARAEKPKWKSSSTSSVRSKDRPRLRFAISSESEGERESDSCRLDRADDESRGKYTNRTPARVNGIPEASLISTDASSVSERLFDSLLASSGALINDKTASRGNCDGVKNQVNKSKRHVHDGSPMLIAEREADSKLREEYSAERINSATKPSCDGPNIVSRRPTCNAPKQDGTAKTRLTKRDVHKILRNIKCTQAVYDSPGERRDLNVIIDESIDVDEDMIHPAISPTYARKVQRPGDSPDVVDTSLKSDVLQQAGPFELPEPQHDGSRMANSYRPLSERRKKQISEWLLTNASESQSDSSFNTVPPSVRKSNSGNSSLERLELSYETPNNRGRINRAQADERTVVNSDRAARTPSTRQNAIGRYFKESRNDSELGARPNGVDRYFKESKTDSEFSTRQNGIDRYFKETKNDSEFRTPDNKPKLPPKGQTDRKVYPGANTSQTNSVMDCASILDKLYGTSWRDKADALLPTSEPRKAPVQPVNRIVQTERKPVAKDQYRTVDSDSDGCDLVGNDIKPGQRRNIQRKQKVNSFINDESLSDSGSESMYYSALTNPTTFTSKSTKSVPVPASIKRLQVLCDPDTDDEDKASDDPKKLHGRKLSFSDEESSSTSEFDPGDYVGPKYVRNQEVKGPTSCKVAPKFEPAAANKSAGCETFLASLSNTVPMTRAHPDAKKYRLDYKSRKEELCKKLYELYNERVFENKLPRDMSIEWNVRMRGTAGYCYNKKSTKLISGSVVKSSRIVLATKILDTPDRLRDTLIHEMCHAASWIIDNVSDGHGLFWTRWVDKAMKKFPELPPVRRCHSYEIKTKFTYRCTGCGYSIGRHSKSLDIERKRCGYCYGKFELFVNKTTKSGTVQVQTPKREPTGFALYVKQNYNSVKREKSNMKHAEVMKLLGAAM